MTTTNPAPVTASPEEALEVAADIRKLLESAPSHIWLDLGEGLEALTDDGSFRDLKEVTWSEDNATGAGIKYVRLTTDAARDVLAERKRQISAEGWTPAHDDHYKHGDLASAAACYATQGRYHYPTAGKPGPTWPWPPDAWKPTSYRRNLVKAGALILAEIERLDRAALATAKSGGA